MQTIANDRDVICREILNELPAWFGIPASIDEYAGAAIGMEMLGYADRGIVAGFVMLRNTSAVATDVYVLAIRPAYHRRGIGRALIDAAARWARTRNHRYLTVKTLGPSRPDAAYDATRAFYAAVGFEPLEELAELWDGNPCLFMVKPL